MSIETLNNYNYHNNINKLLELHVQPNNFFTSMEEASYEVTVYLSWSKNYIECQTLHQATWSFFPLDYASGQSKCGNFKQKALFILHRFYFLELVDFFLSLKHH